MRSVAMRRPMAVEAEHPQATRGERVGSRAAHRAEADHDHIVLGGHL